MDGFDVGASAETRSALPCRWPGNEGERSAPALATISDGRVTAHCVAPLNVTVAILAPPAVRTERIRFMWTIREPPGVGAPVTFSFASILSVSLSNPRSSARSARRAVSSTTTADGHSRIEPASKSDGSEPTASATDTAKSVDRADRPAPSRALARLKLSQSLRLMVASCTFRA